MEIWDKCGRAMAKRLVAGLSLRRPVFAPWSVHVGFAVDKVALGQVFLLVLRVSPVNISLHHRSILICHFLVRCAISLTKQLIIISLVVRASSLILHLAGTEEISIIIFTFMR
jgi:hypothetical protein